MTTSQPLTDNPGLGLSGKLSTTLEGTGQMQFPPCASITPVTEHKRVLAVPLKMTCLYFAYLRMNLISLTRPQVLGAPGLRLLYLCMAGSMQCIF